ncbi:hypothetical protein [Streptomyces sp. NPDC046197]|uniref:hypothetical protein n=1 Tax=Streptomyces sp. NPDC046197 TaxID=3154337 RepID=UPI003400BC25
MLEKVDVAPAERADVALRLPRLEFDDDGVLRRTAGDYQAGAGPALLTEGATPASASRRSMSVFRASRVTHAAVGRGPTGDPHAPGGVLDCREDVRGRPGQGLGREEIGGADGLCLTV